MDRAGEKSLLSTFELIVDTREQRTARAKKRFDSFSVPYKKGILDYGDYTWNITLKEGQMYDIDKRIYPKCVVERKMSLDELAGNMGRDRERFKREFERATKAGAIVYLVCENGSWEKILSGSYRSKMNPNAFFNSLIAWEARYNLRIVFCHPETTAKLIQEILYRDLKQRIENGEIDVQQHGVLSDMV